MLKNIIIVNDCAYINGGAAKVSIQSAIAFSNLNFNVFFFAATGPIDDGLKRSKVTVKCLGLDDINHGSVLTAIKNGIWNKTVGEEFLCFLRGFSPDDTIVHIHGWTKALSSVVVKISCDGGYKTVITLHDYFSICPNGGFYDYRKQKLCTKIPMSASCVFCNCDKRNYVQKCWRIVRQFVQDKNIRNNPDIVFVSISQRNENAVRPYVRSKKFYRIDNPVQLADKQICDSTSSNVFLYVGRLSEEKGVELFCQAVTELKTQYDIEGVVVGDGALLERLKDNYSEIRFEGWKSPEDVQKIMQISRVLVLPSKWYEGAPLTIIEAMSAGLPCVVSDCTSATEIVQDSINGYVFESGNVDSLKEKLIKTIDNIELLRVQKELLNTFRIERYMESTYIRNLTELYKELLL